MTPEEKQKYDKIGKGIMQNRKYERERAEESRRLGEEADKRIAERQEQERLRQERLKQHPSERSDNGVKYMPPLEKEEPKKVEPPVKKTFGESEVAKKIFNTTKTAGEQVVGDMSRQVPFLKRDRTPLEKYMDKTLKDKK